VVASNLARVYQKLHGRLTTFCHYINAFSRLARLSLFIANGEIAVYKGSSLV